MRERFGWVPDWAIDAAIIGGEALGLVLGLGAVVILVVTIAAALGR